MKLNALIKKLQKLQSELRKRNKRCNPLVVVDFDENGYFNVEEILEDVDEEETVINIRSSNEM